MPDENHTHRWAIEPSDMARFEFDPEARMHGGVARGVPYQLNDGRCLDCGESRTFRGVDFNSLDLTMESDSGVSKLAEAFA